MQTTTETAEKTALHYIAIMPNAWGKGNSKATAIRRAKEAHGSHCTPKYTVVYQYPRENDTGVYVSNMGDLYGEGLVKIMDNRKK